MSERTNSVLRDELLRMMHEDQESFSKRDSNHEHHKTRLKEIIQEFGWPTRELVGADGAIAAWIIVQHDDDLPWMKECLKRMEALMECDEVRREDVAYLRDRICVAQGRPQRYGTQCIPSADGTISLAPVDDPIRVDEYRRSMGILESVEQYLAFMRSRK